MQKKKSENKRAALGRGLASLLSSSVNDNIVTKDYFLCDIDKIVSNKYQPRLVFNDDALKELSISIQKFGVLQPIIIKKTEGGYELIAGERRLKASKLAGLTQIPAILKKTDDENQLELALIENIQRENLNPIEEYKAYALLIKKFNLTQDELSKILGKNRSTIANFLRLENLDEYVREALQNNKITMGHAKAILSITDKKAQVDITDEIVKGGLSVRATENFIKEILTGSVKKKNKPVKKEIPEEILELSYNISKKLGSKVDIDIKEDEEGKLKIKFSSKEELYRIADLLL